MQCRRGTYSNVTHKIVRRVIQRCASGTADRQIANGAGDFSRIRRTVESIPLQSRSSVQCDRAAKCENFAARAADGRNSRTQICDDDVVTDDTAHTAQQ